MPNTAAIEVRNVPVGNIPIGNGWELITGNQHTNRWERSAVSLAKHDLLCLLDRETALLASARAMLAAGLKPSFLRKKVRIAQAYADIGRLKEDPEVYAARVVAESNAQNEALVARTEAEIARINAELAAIQAPVREAA